MGKGKVIFSALKAIGKWVAKNPDVAIDAVDRFVVHPKKQEETKTNYDEQLLLAEERINQLGAAALELEDKIEGEIKQLQSDLEAVREQVLTLKKILYVIGAVVGVAVIAIVLLAIF